MSKLKLNEAQILKVIESLSWSIYYLHPYIQDFILLHYPSVFITILTILTYIRFGVISFPFPMLKTKCYLSQYKVECKPTVKMAQVNFFLNY
jgi:hypothetical protein